MRCLKEQQLLVQLLEHFQCVRTVELKTLTVTQNVMSKHMLMLLVFVHYVIQVVLPVSEPFLVNASAVLIGKIMNQ